MKLDTTGLLEPQIQHAHLLAASLKDNGISWDGTVMGGGKTYTASALARFVSQTQNKKVFVICPKKVTGKWKNTLNDYGVKPECVINLELIVRGNTKWLKYRKPNKKERADGVEKMMLSVLKIPKDWFIILDESHRCKGTTSLSAGLLLALKRQSYMFHMISATQAMTPLDMRAFGNAVGLHDGSMKDFKRFCVEAGATWEGRWGKLLFDEGNKETAAKMQKIHNYLYHEKKIGSRLERHHFKGIFPNNQIIAEAYDMGDNSNKIQSAYDEMNYELDMLEDRTENYRDHILAILIKARRRIELLKVPTLVELAIDSFEEGHSPILFVNFTDTINALHERISSHVDKQKIALMYGERSEKQNASDLEQFQMDYKRIMIANLASGSESVDMHDLNGQFPRDSYINPSWNAIKILQSVGRPDRAHAKTDVRTYFTFADRTLETGICKRFQFRKDNLDILNNGDLVPSDRIFQFGAGKDI